MTSLVLVLVALAGTPAPGVLQDGHEERFAAFFRDATGPRGGLRGWTVDAITLGPECRAVVSLRTPHGHPVRAAMSPSLEGGLTMEFLGDPSPENQGALLPGLPEGDLAALFAEACAPRPPTHLWDEARGLDPGDAGEPLPPAPVPGTRGLAAAGLLAFLAFLAALRARGKELRRFLAGTSAVERLTLGALGLGAALRLVVLLRTEILPPELVFYLPRAGQAPAGHEGGFPAALLEGRVLFLLLREPWALLGDHLGVGGGTTWLRLPGPAAWLLLAGAVAALGRRLAAPRAALATVLALALMPHPGLLGTPLRPELLEAALVAWTLERLAAGPAAGRSLLAVVSAAAWSGPLGAVFGLCALAAHGVRGAQPGGSPPPTAGLLLALAVMTPPLLAALAPMTPEAPAPWPLDGSFREALEYLRSQRALDVGWNPLALAGAAFDPAGGGVSALAGLLLVPGLLLLAALRPGEGLVLLGGLGLAWARAMAAPLHPTAFLPLAAPLLFGALRALELLAVWRRGLRFPAAAASALLLCLCLGASVLSDVLASVPGGTGTGGLQLLLRRERLGALLERGAAEAGARELLVLGDRADVAALALCPHRETRVRAAHCAIAALYSADGTVREARLGPWRLLRAGDGLEEEPCAALGWAEAAAGGRDRPFLVLRTRRDEALDRDSGGCRWDLATRLLLDRCTEVGVTGSFALLRCAPAPTGPGG